MPKEIISYEDFAKVDLRVGEIVTAEKVSGSEKLLKLNVLLGEETRQILAGIQSGYVPEDLIGQQVVVVANLSPRTLMGFASEGMLLAAGGEAGAPVLLGPLSRVLPGISIR